jgi:hypothetical protein
MGCAEYMSAMINRHIVPSGRHTQLRPCVDIRNTVAAPFHPNMCRICRTHTAIESSDSHFVRVRCCFFSIRRVDNIGIEEDSVRIEVGFAASLLALVPPRDIRPS